MDKLLDIVEEDSSAGEIKEKNEIFSFKSEDMGLYQNYLKRIPKFLQRGSIFYINH